MAETATKPRALVTDYVGDPDFIAMPYALKLNTLYKALQSDYELQRLDDTNQREVLDYVLTQGARGETEPVPSQAELSQTTFQEAPLLPPNQAAAAPLPTGADARAVAVQEAPIPIRMGIQAATKAADVVGLPAQLAGLYTRGVQGIARLTGPEIAVEGLERRAQAFENPAVSAPATTALVGEQGFYPEETQVARTLQHILNSAASGATSGLLFGTALASRIPLTEQAARGAYLAAQGATAGGIAKEHLGAGPWTQAAVELVAGGASPDEVRDLYTYLAARPALQKRLANVVRRVPTYREKLEEFAKIQETVPELQGDLATRTAIPQLESTRRDLVRRRPYNFVPFTQREEGDIVALTQAVTSRLPPPSPEAVRTVLDEASTPVVAVKRAARQARDAAASAREEAAMVAAQTQPLLKEIRTRAATQIDTLIERKRGLEQRLDDVVRERQDVLQQLDADKHLLSRSQLAERRRLVDEKRAQEQGFRDELLDIRREHDRALKQADDAVQIVADEVRGTSREATRNLRLAQQARDTATTEIQQLTDTAKKQLTTAVKETTPEEIALAASGDALAQGKLARFERDGAHVRSVYEQARERLRRDAELPENYGNPAYRLTQANPERLEGNLANFEARMQAEMRDSFVPDPTVANMRQILQEKGQSLSLYDLHSMRSRILDDMRHTSPGTRRDQTLKLLLGTVNAEMDTVANQVPGLAEEYARVRNWYRGEIQRFTSGGGALAVRTDPVTGKPLYQAADLAQRAFAPGPSLGQVSGVQARNLQHFRTYLRDLDAFESSEMLKGDTANTAFIADVQAARSAITDIAKTSLYTSAVDPVSGALDPAKAAAWFRSHATLINESPELQRAFATPQQRLATIRELEDRAHQVAVFHGDDVAEARRAQQLVREEGQDAATLAQHEARAQRGAAGDVRQVREDVVRGEQQQVADAQLGAQRQLEDASLAQGEEAFLARQALQGAQRTRALSRREIANATRAQTAAVTAQQAAEEAPLQAQQQQARATALAERQRARLATADEQQAVQDYDAFFGSGAAARAERQAGVARSTLGFRPEDMIADIERKGETERLRAYEGLFRLAKDDPETTQTILGAMWQHHLGRSGQRAETLPGQPLLPDAAETRAFLQKNKALLDRYVSKTYADDLEYITKGFERYERLAKANAPIPEELGGTSLGRDITLAAATTLGARGAGAGYLMAMAIGKLTFMGERFMNAINVRTLSEMLLDPETTGVMRRIVDPTTNPVWRQTALHNLVLRSGALAQTATPPPE